MDVVGVLLERSLVFLGVVGNVVCVYITFVFGENIVVGGSDVLRLSLNFR